MPSTPFRSSKARPRAGLYQDITAKIIHALESGRAPWAQPWASGMRRTPIGIPTNAATGRRYAGVNILLLWAAVVDAHFSRQAWLTFRQAQALGGTVRRGEHGTSIVFADRVTPQDQAAAAAGEAETRRDIYFLRRFTVFNLDQCEGLPAELSPPSDPVDDGLILPRARALIEATGADFRVGGDQAFYSPVHDYVRVPRPEAFFEPINWHRTALHELAHWTGHRTRLARDQTGAFGDGDYAREELVAEMASAFACAALGIVPTVRHADYIGAWLEVLHADNRAIVRAASAASKAADFLLAFAPDPGAVGE